MHPRLTAAEIAPEHAWFKSSYSDPGQNCVEVASQHAWFKSTYSDAGQNCVEAARLTPGIAIRDSKNPTGPALLLPPAAWTPFITHVSAL